MLNNKVLIPYAPPTPPEGEHRYIIKKFTIGKDKMEKMLKNLAQKIFKIAKIYRIYQNLIF